MVLSVMGLNNLNPVPVPPRRGQALDHPTALAPVDSVPETPPIPEASRSDAEVATLNQERALPALPLKGMLPGDTATLMGGGWAVTFPANSDTAAAAQATFHFKARVVAAVSSASPMQTSANLFHSSADGEAALAAYQHLRPSHLSLGEVVASRVDILD